MNEQAIKLYEQAQADYPMLKTQIEAQVVRWFWASGGMGVFSLEKKTKSSVIALTILQKRNVTM